MKRPSHKTTPINDPGIHGRLSPNHKCAKGHKPDVVAPEHYEQELDTRPSWALREGSRHFEEKSAVFEAVHKVTERLNALGIPYAVVGAMALFRHGLRRFTEDVDILVTKKDLKRIHEELEGAGYLPVHARSKNLRDTDLGVRIEFLTTGEYPGDGKEKPVAFPDPESVSEEHEGIRYANLPSLVEMKLASGMTNVSRLKDLSDIMELITILNLPEEFATKLNPYVRRKYHELWKQGRKRYIAVWRNKRLTSDAKTLEDMIGALRDAASHLEAMLKDGVVLENSGGIADDYARLVTTDPAVARKYDMLEESEFWQDEEAEGDPGKGKDGSVG